MHATSHGDPPRQHQNWQNWTVDSNSSRLSTVLYTPQSAQFLWYCCRTGLHLLWARTKELCFTFAFTIHHFLKPLSPPPFQQSGNPLCPFLYQDAPPCLLCALCVITLGYFPEITKAKCIQFPNFPSAAEQCVTHSSICSPHWYLSLAVVTGVY